MKSTYSTYGKMPFRVKSLKSSIANFEKIEEIEKNFEKTDRVIFNFSIKNDTNLSRLVLKNLYESMNRNLI